MSISLRAVALRKLLACGLPADRARAALKGINPAMVILNPGRHAADYFIVSDEAFWGGLLSSIMG